MKPTLQEKSDKKGVSKFPQINFSINFRMAFGIVLIIASFISAFIISSSTNRMVKVWSSKVDLAPGAIIEADDIVQTEVLLPRNISMYLDGSAPIVGSSVLRQLSAAELIPAYALSNETNFNLRKVPISVSGSRLPSGLKVGDVIDLYAVPKQVISSNGDVSFKPGLVISQLAVDGVDLEASKLGGEVGITLLVPAESVNRVISAVAVSDFVLVKTP